MTDVLHDLITTLETAIANPTNSAHWREVNLAIDNIRYQSLREECGCCGQMMMHCSCSSLPNEAGLALEGQR